MAITSTKKLHMHEVWLTQYVQYTSKQETRRGPKVFLENVNCNAVRLWPPPRMDVMYVLKQGFKKPLPPWTPPGDKKIWFMIMFGIFFLNHSHLYPAPWTPPDHPWMNIKIFLVAFSNIHIWHWTQVVTGAALNTKYLRTLTPSDIRHKLYLLW